jgi:V8-like Glu-specific endopeptidase
LTHSNTFKSINKERIDYEIDTKEGQSGCPVYKVDDSRKVVAIHKAYDPQKKLNFATLIT